MQGSKKVIALLNEGLKAELTAINQYILHAEMCQNWGYERLYKRIKKESIDEMKHAERLIERILFLEGVPNMTELFPIKVGANVKAQFENDLKLEKDAVDRYNAMIVTCADERDNTSRELVEELLANEEEHVDWIEAQLYQIQEIGLERYLSQQIRKED